MNAVTFTDNSSSSHYSATFQAIKEQEVMVKIDFTSDNTEVYNKPFRLRDLRWSIMKAKPRAPGPDRIHNNLLKHLPEDTLKTLKEILNKIWTSADFPQQWRAATVIPIPKPNKDHNDPLSYWPIALTSCLCKILERIINTRFIWYLEKYKILDRSQCGFIKHRSKTDHLVSLERYLRGGIQKLVQTKWDVAVHGRDLYLVKPTLGPPKKFQHLTRAEEVVITRLRIGHTKATKSHILSRGPPTACHHCGQTLTIEHMLLECAVLQECHDEYYTVDSLNALFETSPETCIVEFLREAGFFSLIWCNL